MEDNKTLIEIDYKKLFDEVLRSTCRNSRFYETMNHIQHGNTTVYEHCISVAYNSYRLALFLKLPVNERALIRGALLHDYFLYDWHKNDHPHRLHGFFHPKLALQNAEEDFILSEVEKDVIIKHMFPLTPIPPKCVEGILVCLVDKMCSIYEIFYFAYIFEYKKRLFESARITWSKRFDFRRKNDEY